MKAAALLCLVLIISMVAMSHVEAAKKSGGRRTHVSTCKKGSRGCHNGEGGDNDNDPTENCWLWWCKNKKTT